MKKYILQELYIIDGHYFWFNITRSDDKEYIIELKNVYKNKHKNGIFQVIEVLS